MFTSSSTNRTAAILGLTTLGAPSTMVFSPLQVGCFALNAPLALWAGRDRALERPWISVAFAAKTLTEAFVTTWSASRVPRRRASFRYGVAGAVASWAIAALALTEAARGVKTILHRRRVKAVGAVVHRPGSHHAPPLEAPVDAIAAAVE